MLTAKFNAVTISTTEGTGPEYLKKMTFSANISGIRTTVIYLLFWSKSNLIIILSSRKAKFNAVTISSTAATGPEYLTNNVLTEIGHG